MSLSEFTFIILAAGKGTRLNADQPKPLVKIGGTPLVEPILNKGRELPFAKRIVVISAYTKGIEELYPWPELTYVHSEPRGTGYCVAQALDQTTTPFVIVAQADDSFFLPAATIERLAAQQVSGLVPATMAAAQVTRPAHYATIRHENGELRAIERDQAAFDAPPPKDVPSGLYAFQTEWLRRRLAEVPFNSVGEQSLPQVFNLALADGEVTGVFLYSGQEWYGINTPEELASASTYFNSL